MVMSIYALGHGEPMAANVKDCIVFGEYTDRWREKARHNIKEIRALRRKVARERNIHIRYALNCELEYKVNKLDGVMGAYKKCVKDAVKIKRSVRLSLAG